MKLPFNPNDVAVANGNFFGFPYSIEEAALVLITAPWEVTTSYGGGTAKGPNAIIEASPQLDFFDFDFPNTLQHKIGTDTTLNTKITEKNNEFRVLASKLIEKLENGEVFTEEDAKTQQKINEASEWLNETIYQQAKQYISKQQIPCLVGGDHSTPFGLIKALAEKQELGILQIDAHADLRKAYEGFEYSHASIMYNALKLPGVKSLTQVGIRDLCEDEFNLASENPNIHLFNDFQLNYERYEGKLWQEQVSEIISTLPEFVYISFDIDGLLPYLTPNTGTPVAGGLGFMQISYLLKKLVESGKKIVAFDLNEVAPEQNGEWNANVGARVLYKLCSACLATNKK